MMQQIGFNGTPTFIIGDQMLEGALGYDALKAAVDKARKKG
jgi:protein-disulfide isomerase